MQILSLKTPFMGVQAIEKIEIRRFLLLIGEQASGKSTLAKLIYFFQKVPEYIYESVVRAMNKNQPFDPSIQIGYELRDRFYETFGILSQKELNICFYYLDKDEEILDVHIEIYKKEDNKIYVKFSEQLRIWTYRSVHNALVSNQNIIEINEKNKTNGFLSIEKSHLQETLRNNLNDHFSNENTDFTYLIAGRSSTVAFPEMIEAKLEAELENVIENAIKKQNFGKRIGNERLFLQFINWARELMKFF